MLSGSAGGASPSVVLCDSVTFRYGRRTVLRGVDAQLHGGVTGLLGPNGAGKSTLISLLAALRRPESGAILLDGVDLSSGRGASRSLRQQIGYLPQHFSLLHRSTVLRNVEYAAWARGVHPREVRAAALEAVEAVGLGDRLSDAAGSLSGGQRQRLGIACAISHQPSVLLLDEPTVGLDPLQRVSVREHLGRLASRATILVSTHLVEDLEQIATQLLVLASGVIAFDGSVDELRALGNAGVARPGLSPLESGYAAVLDREVAA